MSGLEAIEEKNFQRKLANMRSKVCANQEYDEEREEKLNREELKQSLLDKFYNMYCNPDRSNKHEVQIASLAPSISSSLLKRRKQSLNEISLKIGDTLNENRKVS